MKRCRHILAVQSNRSLSWRDVRWYGDAHKHVSAADLVGSPRHRRDLIARTCRPHLARNGESEQKTQQRRRETSVPHHAAYYTTGVPGFPLVVATHIK